VDGKTALYMASDSGDTEGVEELLRTPGIDVNLADKDGRTPLYAAPLHGRLRIVELLLETPGIDVNQADKDGESPLRAAVDGSLEHYLYQHEMDEFMGGAGTTFRRYDEVVSLLGTAPGIDVNLADKDGQTPYDMAKCEPIRSLLESMGAKAAS